MPLYISIFFPKINFYTVKNYWMAYNKIKQEYRYKNLGNDYFSR